MVVGAQVEHIETVIVGVVSGLAVLEARETVMECVPVGVPNSQAQQGRPGVEVPQIERVRTSYVAVDVVVTDYDVDSLVSFYISFEAVLTCET